MTDYTAHKNPDQLQIQLNQRKLFPDAESSNSEPLILQSLQFCPSSCTFEKNGEVQVSIAVINLFSFLSFIQRVHGITETSRLKETDSSGNASAAWAPDSYQTIIEAAYGKHTVLSEANAHCIDRMIITGRRRQKTECCFPAVCL